MALVTVAAAMSAYGAYLAFAVDAGAPTGGSRWVVGIAVFVTSALVGKGIGLALARRRRET